MTSGGAANADRPGKDDEVDAIRTIQDEHRGFAAVLHGLGYLMGELREHADAPVLDALGAMIYYLDVYLEQIHHPRESEYVFRLLRLRCRDAAAVLDVVEREHEAGALSMRALAHAFMRYQHGGASEFPALAAAVAAYSKLEYDHMRREEREILPLAEKFLLPDDWGMIDMAFKGGAVPRFGVAATEKYRKLFTRIVALAPPPIGVGPAHEPARSQGPRPVGPPAA